MIELKEFCKVPFPDRLFEEYEVTENSIKANVNTSKVIDMMKHFIAMHNEPLFFILEIPRKAQIDNTNKIITNPKEDVDVYFIDGLDAENACFYLDSIGNFLVKDGLNTFGIGCHFSHDEILFGKYNVMTIFTQSTENYCDFFNDFKIVRTNNLITAWETFDSEHPGNSMMYVSKSTDKTIYDIPKDYKKYGMYLYTG